MTFSWLSFWIGGSVGAAIGWMGAVVIIERQRR